MLGELFMVDRDILFREIVLSTYGRTQEYKNVECQKCHAFNDIEVQVEELLEYTGTDVRNPESRSVRLRDDTEVTFRFPKGKDVTAVAQGQNPLTPAEVDTELIAMVLHEVSGRKQANPREWARNLGMADRRRIVEAINQQPTMKFKEVEVSCTSCGSAMPPVIGWADLLRL